MTGGRRLQEVLASTSTDLGDAVSSADTTRLRIRASYARGVLDALAAIMADEDAVAEQADTTTPVAREARRDPATGRFAPSEHTQVLCDGTEPAATS